MECVPVFIMYLFDCLLTYLTVCSNVDAFIVIFF